ncbi:Uncharacterised protein [BD1-7 clade bacterium]|nr:Uncharacterised protein [BD1-7 clade bacterium]
MRTLIITESCKVLSQTTKECLNNNLFQAFEYMGFLHATDEVRVTFS